MKMTKEKEKEFRKNISTIGVALTAAFEKAGIPNFFQTSQSVESSTHEYIVQISVGRTKKEEENNEER